MTKESKKEQSIELLNLLAIYRAAKSFAGGKI